MAKSTTKRRKKQISYIDKYKALKDNKMIRWNVKGKRTDQGLSPYQKYKINRAYKEYKEIGGKADIFYPRKKAHETELAYIRRLNRIKRNSGIGETDINGIVFESKLIDKLRVNNKEDKLFIEVKTDKTVSSREFFPIDRIEFNKDPRNYMEGLFDQFQGIEFTNNDSVVPIHSHWTGTGASMEDMEFIDDFIDTVTGWAFQYGSEMNTAIATGTQSEAKQAISKYDNFLTGLLFEFERSK